MQQQSNLAKHSTRRTSLSVSSLAGQPRLGLAGLEALTQPGSVHEEVRMRMTDAAAQLAELASRQVRWQDGCLPPGAVAALCAGQVAVCYILL